jgi:hypothetical protein
MKPLRSRHTGKGVIFYFTKNKDGEEKLFKETKGRFWLFSRVVKLREFLSLGSFSFTYVYFEIWKAAIFVNFLIPYEGAYTQFPR